MMENKRPKTILFICNEINYNIYNRRSAIDSILLSVLINLSDNHNILVNGIELDVSSSKKASDPPSSMGIKAMITSMIPKRIKERLKMRRLLKNSDNLRKDLEGRGFNKIDYVFELYKLGSSCGPALAKYYNAEYVLYYDSPVVEQYEDIWGISVPEKSKMELAQKRAISNADRIICYSNPVKDYLMGLGAKGRISIFQSLDYSRLTPMSRTIEQDVINIGFIGSFMHWHRVDLLIRAFDEIYAKNPNLKLYLIGSGETFIKDKQLANSLKSNKAIIFTGFVDGERLNHYKSILHIGVMPGSNWYGIPTKVFEYSMIKIPSIAPDTPTIKDIFDNGENIELFEWENYESLVAVLQDLITDENKRAEIGKKAFDFVGNNLTSDKSKEFYDSLFFE